MADPPGFTHAARGNDHLRLRVRVYRNGFLRGDGQVKVVEEHRIDAPVQQGPGIVVKVFPRRLLEDGRCFHGQRAVQNDSEIRAGLYQPLFLDLADEVEDLLRASDRESRNDHVAAAPQRPVDHLRQLVDIGPVAFMRRVQAIAVGRFQDHVIRRIHGLRIADQRPVQIAHVAAEQELARCISLRQPQLDMRSTEQVPRVPETDHHVFPDLRDLVEAHRDEEPERRLRVFARIDRFDQFLAGPFVFSVLPLDLGFLDLRAVHQHDAAEIHRGLGRIDRAAEAPFVQQGQIPRMVDMRMGQKDRVDRSGIYRQVLIDVDVFPLLHAAVHQITGIAHLQIGHGTGHLMGGPQKCDLHSVLLRSPRRSAVRITAQIPDFCFDYSRKW